MTGNKEEEGIVHDISFDEVVKMAQGWRPDHIEAAGADIVIGIRVYRPGYQGADP
jgi:hypothetical protein